MLACSLGRASGHIRGEDNAVMLLRAPGGLSVVVEGSMTAAGYATRAPDRVEIAGTRCSVTLENGTLRLFGAEEQTLHYDEDAVRQACFDDAVQHFTDRLRAGRGDFWTSASDQLGSLRLMDQAYALAGAIRPLQDTAVHGMRLRRSAAHMRARRRRSPPEAPPAPVSYTHLRAHET